MSNNNQFEQIKKTDKNAIEFWSARDLYPLLGYVRWENFLTAVDRAKEACKNSGQKVADQFRGTTKLIVMAKGATRTLEDFKLTRYACYLVAQNGDPRKVEIAKAQTYFAIKTREKEVQDRLLEEQSRIYVRGQVKLHNKNLVGVAKKAGVTNFANFQDKGYMGLYNGLRNSEIKKKKGIQENQNLLDHVGSEELGANLFRITQAEAMIKRENIVGEDRAGEAHNLVGRKVRNTIRTLGGQMPEDLPREEHIKKLERKLKSPKKIKKLAN